LAKKIWRKKFGEKMDFMTQNKVKICKNLIITLAFEKNAIFAENCDHNIDPRPGSEDKTLFPNF
jgi:hypothetical protein